MALPVPNNIIDRSLLMRRVTITAVDVANMKVTAADSRGMVFPIDITLQGPIAFIPKMGEDWIIEKVQELWKLLYRLERSDDKTPITNFRPGDSRVNGNMLIDGDLIINGIRQNTLDVIYDEEPEGVADGTNTDFLLSQIPSQIINITVNGLRTANFTTVGAYVVFGIAPWEDSKILVSYYHYPLITKGQTGEGDG